MRRGHCVHCGGALVWVVDDRAEPVALSATPTGDGLVRHGTDGGQVRRCRIWARHSCPATVTADQALGQRSQGSGDVQ